MTTETERNAERAKRAAALLGYQFAAPERLAQALTHRSAAGAGGLASNERLEFIGDRVLGLVIAEWLIERYPDEREGRLGPRLAHLVSRSALAAIADEVGLANLLDVSPGETRRGVRHNASVLADALEALLGALYLDGGLAPAQRFIRARFASRIEAQDQFEPPKDPKTALQEVALSRAPILPDYQIIAQSGPAHAPKFRVRVMLGDLAAEAEAGSKRAAEQAAAKRLLERLGE